MSSIMAVTAESGSLLAYRWGKYRLCARERTPKQALDRVPRVKFEGRRLSIGLKIKSASLKLDHGGDEIHLFDPLRHVT